MEAIIALTEREEQRAAELARKRKEVEEAQKRVQEVQDIQKTAECVTKRKDGGGEGAAKVGTVIIQYIRPNPKPVSSARSTRYRDPSRFYQVKKQGK